MSNTENDDAATLEWIEEHVKDAIPEYLLHPEVEPLEEELQEEKDELDEFLTPAADAPNSPVIFSKPVQRGIYKTLAAVTILVGVSLVAVVLSQRLFG